MRPSSLDLLLDLLLLALHHVGGTDRRVIRVEAGRATGIALMQQVVALVELHLDGFEPRLLGRPQAAIGGRTLPELLLLARELVDPLEDRFVNHVRLLVLVVSTEPTAYRRRMASGSGTGRGEIVFACIAPHGDLAIPEACPPERRTVAAATQAGMTELGRRFVAAGPDVVVVLTPHGIHVEGRFAVVVAGRTAGTLEDTPQVALDVPVDRELALGIVAALRDARLPAAGVSYGGNVPSESVMPLDWGTLIPLWYLGGRRTPPVPVVVVAPARDLSTDDHVGAGEALPAAIAASGRRAAVVASADQAHAHDADGPYGFDPAAGVHDDLVVALLREDRLRALRDLDPALVAAAKPDAWWQELMLLGAIGERWTPELLSYEAPTYYGMLCAAFVPPGD